MTRRPDENRDFTALQPDYTGEWSAGSGPISRRAADILDSLSDAVSAFDLEWRWVYLNPVARETLRALGRDPDTVIGKVVWEELPMLLDTRFEAETRRALEEGRVVEFEEYLPELGRWLELRIVPTRGLVTTHARDVTARRDADRSAELGAQRAVRLLALATKLGTATSPSDVLDSALHAAIEATDAQAGSVAILHDSPQHGRAFEMTAAAGYGASLERRFRHFPLQEGRPVSDAVTSGRIVFVSSKAEWDARYLKTGVTASELPGEALACIPIMINGRGVAALSLTFREPRRFDEPLLTFLSTIGEQTAIALARARAFDRERRAREASAFLAEASRVLASSLDYEETLRTVARSAVPRLGDWCAVDILTDPDATTWPPRVERLAVVHQEPEKIALAEELERRYPPDWNTNEGIVGAIRSRAVTFVPLVTDEMLVAGTPDPERLALLREFGFHAVIIVPLVARDRTLGALTLITSESERPYTQDDLEMAQELAHRASTAIDNARLYRIAERARHEAETANAAKSDFLATMSHELRTPLNAIGGYSDLLEMGLHGPLTEQQLDAVRRIKRAHLNLLSLVEDVLSFARIESGRLEYRFATVPLHPLLQGLEAFIAPQIAARGLAYRYDSVAGSLIVWADPEKTEQVLLNLLSNAVKFTERGVIEVTATADERVVRVSVRDTGTGIPAEKLEKIFEPFVQLESGLTRRSQGSGLGLAISRDIARAMGGDVTVNSTVGQGSTFTLILPRHRS